MRRSTFPVIAVICLFGVWNDAVADDAAKPQAEVSKFELHDGDRVVFLGNTLIERAQKYGYWETMLTARYPDRDITFRNLGWSGDTVWAESRGIFDPPAVGYKRMIEHVGRLKPTVIFVGYGNNEAFAGKEGLPAFIKQYNKLLDDLTGVSAEGVRFVLLSPTWLTPRDLLDHVLVERRKLRNGERAIYSDALRELSEERQAYFVDLISAMKTHYEFAPATPDLVMDQAWQLTDYGYEVSGLTGQLFPSPTNLRDAIAWSQRRMALVDISADGKVTSQQYVTANRVSGTAERLKLNIVFRRFPADSIHFKVAGLRPGEYAIKVGRQTLQESDDATLREGITVCVSHSQSKDFAPNGLQYEKLRQAIIEKNRLYFYRWRPQNITYLFGFRKHEQGQNAKELTEFDKLIAAKEAEINKLKKPVPHTYEIIRVKDKK